ncbi:MAG: inner membrane CreD family protein, partial [Alphaproteobacteria bacterium]|nr:inner membrane CreD family protein [Alphaproteobacteria bacterium]
MTDPAAPPLPEARRAMAPAFKVLLIAAVVVALLIPLFLVHQAIEERHDRHRAAVAEIGF